jgi:formylglycine-generating enzyme required for sulfatase activity
MRNHDGTMIDERPITVMEYKEFIFYQRGERKQYLLPIPEDNLKFYLDTKNHHKSVKGISFDKAKAYCDWRSDVWNSKGLDYHFTYKLPAYSEWKKYEINPAYGDLAGEWTFNSDIFSIYNYETREIENRDNYDDIGFRCKVVYEELSED